MLDIEIYVDADGVLANFEGRVFDDLQSQKLRADWFDGLKLYDMLHLKSFSSDDVKKTFAGQQTDPKMKDLKKRWNTYFDYIHRVADKPGFFRNLDLMPNAQDLLNLCSKLTGKLPNILTAPMSNNVHCEPEKKEWFEEHFTGQYNRFICLKEKAQYANSKSILIDDRERYTKPFIAAGGHAILYKSFEQTKKDLIKLIEELSQNKNVTNTSNKPIFENRNVSYSGIVLDERSRNKLIEVFGPTWELHDGFEPLAHHMTICMGPLPTDKKDLLGKKVELEVVAFAGDDKVKAVEVR